jgi:prolipoprotein diacylglyceryltransferase
MLFWTYLLLYSVGRFFVQFYRVDTVFAMGISQAQLLSVLTAMVAAWFLVFMLNRSRLRPGAQRADKVRVGKAAGAGDSRPDTPVASRP